jgi:hypothetical protein
MLKITEINCLTGIEIVRDMTPEEFASYEELQKQKAIDEATPK